MIKNVHYNTLLGAIFFRDEKYKGMKKHTIREWSVEPGTVLRHVIRPYQKDRKVLAETVCTSCQSIQIIPSERSVQLLDEGRFLTEEQLLQIARNDGFSTVGSFFKYFKRYSTFKGYIVHWTELKY